MTEKRVPSSVGYVCNAERVPQLGVRFVALVRLIERQLASYENLTVQAGLSPESPVAFERERWEINAAKISALNHVHELIESLPLKVLAEKSPPEALQLERWQVDALLDMLGNIRFAVVAADQDKIERAVDWIDAAADLLSELSEISGNAGTQPGRKDEGERLPVLPEGAATVPPSPIAVGEADLDRVAAEGLPGEFFDGAIAADRIRSLPSNKLAVISELILDELDRRGEAATWTA